jgi:RHS repeat-associated protein
MRDKRRSPRRRGVVVFVLAGMVASLTAAGRAEAAGPTPGRPAVADSVSAPGSPPVDAPGTRAGVDHGPAAAEARATGRAVELADLRTEGSTTVVRPDGRFQTKASAAPVNYRDAKGAWQRIDSSLVPGRGGRGWRNAAGPVGVELPGDGASGAVRVTAGAVEVAFGVPGGRAAGVRSGEAVTYRGVAAGTDVTYRATGTGVSEQFTLAERTASPVFTSTVTVNAGTTVTADAVGIAFTNGPDSLVVPRPWAKDANPDDISGLGIAGTPVVSVDAAPAGVNAWTITTRVDPAWLAAPQRVYPVTVDPVFTARNTSSLADCMLNGDVPAQNNCGWEWQAYGVTAAGNPNRQAIKPDLSAIPLDAVVAQSNMWARVYSNQSGGAKALQAFPITHAWNSSAASYSHADLATGTLWSAAGGDFAAPQGPSYIAAGGTGSTVGIGLHAITQEWASDPAHKAFGFIIKYPNGQESGGQNLVVTYGSEATDPANRPEIDVIWAPRTGSQRFDQHWNQRLSDRSDVGVNLATGNLLVHSQDLAVKGIGVNLAVDRYYNSRAAYVGTSYQAGPSTGRLSPGWTMSPGNDVWLEAIGDSILYHGPTGEQSVFRLIGDGTYTYTSPGQNAQLTWVAGTPNRYKLFFTGAAITYWFTDTGSHGHGVFESVQDLNGNTVSYANNGAPNYTISSATDTYGVTATFSSDASGNVNGLSLSTGRSVAYGYSGTTTRRMASYTDATGAVTDYTYDATSGLLKWIDTPQGGTQKFRTEFGYDPIGRVTQVNVYTTAVGVTPTAAYTTTFSYAAPTASAKATVTVTNARGKIYKYTADSMLRVDGTTDPLGHTSSQVLNANGDPSQFTDGLSAQSTLTWSTDGANTPGDITGPTGAKQIFTYDTTKGSGDPSRYQPKTSTSAAANAAGGTPPATTYGYDNKGNLDKTTDPTGQTVMIERYGSNPSWDPAVGRTCPASGGTLADMQVGQICTVTDGNNNVTTYIYTRSRLTTVKPPDTTGPATATGPTAITYDADNRVRSVVDGKGQRTCYTYDNNDRVTIVGYGANTSCTPTSTITYTFDKAGNLTQRVDPSGTTTYVYDALNRPTKKSIDGTQTNTAAYDQVSNLTKTVSDEGQSTYVYDDANNLLRMGVGTINCVTTPSSCTGFAYDANNARTTITYPNGVVENLGPDGSGRWTNMSATGPGPTTFYNVKYDYNDNGVAGKDTGVIQKLTNNVNSDYTTFGHDNADRLTSRIRYNSAGIAQESFSYTYDNAGNRLSAITPAGSTYYAYDTQNRLCKTSTTAAPSCTTPFGYTYDANGNQLTGGGHTFTYNNKNQTASIDGDSFIYADADQSQRVETNTVYFSNWILGPDATSPASGAGRYYGRTPDGLLIYTNSGATVHYYLHDGEKNVTGLTTSTGTRTATYTYGPYGEQPTATGTDAAKSGFRYKQGWLDTASGLYKFGTRYYSAADARWTQRDPLAGSIAQPSTINRYSYSGCNPVDRWDPSGQNFWGCVAAVANMVAATAAIIAAAANFWNPGGWLGWIVAWGWFIGSFAAVTDQCFG